MLTFFESLQRINCYATVFHNFLNFYSLISSLVAMCIFGTANQMCQLPPKQFSGPEGSTNWAYPLLIYTWFLKYQVWKIKLDELDFLSISNLNFAGYTGSKNQVQTRQKFEFFRNLFFFEFVINSQIDISKIKHR